MTVESVTQAVSNLALQFGEEDADPGAMVCSGRAGVLQEPALASPLTLPSALPNLLAAFCCSLARLVSRCSLEELMRRDPSCKFSSVIQASFGKRGKPQTESFQGSLMT